MVKVAGMTKVAGVPMVVSGEVGKGDKGGQSHQSGSGGKGG